MKKILLPLLIFTSSVTFASEVKSNTQKINGFYLGAGLGSFNYHIKKTDSNNYNEEFIEQTEGNTGKIYSGYQFNKIIAVEVTYTDYGDSQGHYIDIFNDKLTVKLSPTSFSVAANAGYTFANGIRPFALLGLAYIDLNSDQIFLDGEKRVGYKYGFGVEYTPVQLKGVQLRVVYEADSHYEWFLNGWDESMETAIITLDSLYAGISYKF